MADLISRQAAIEALHMHLMYRMGTDSNKKRLDEWINGVPSVQPERKWIPCSERLPEDDVEVFVYLFDRPSPYIAWITDCCWFTEDFQVEKENYPKAWMPLPEPWREEGENR